MNPFISIIDKIELISFIGISKILTSSSFGIGSSRISNILFSSREQISNSFKFVSNEVDGNPKASSKFSEELIGVAPLLISELVPLKLLEKIDPGIAKTSLLYSVANLAVISVPDLSPASIIKTAFDNPAINLFLLGKVHAPAGSFGSYSESKQPPDFIISSANLLLLNG